MKSRPLLTVLLLLAGVLSAMAQTPTDGQKSAVRQRRFGKIELRHLGVGLDAAANHNYYAGPKVYVGLGSHRNLLNVDAGFKYQFWNPVGSGGKERLSLQQLPVFASLKLNVARWTTGNLYLGGEADYCLAMSAKHHLPDGAGSASDKASGQDHAAVRGLLGLKLDRLDVGLFYEYDLAPAMNQKYVYESADYNYRQLYDALFERWRVGVAVSYHIPL